tara:strand:+ start:777 stop:1391 length:615 start_codon:yes stop_codon:yes gene_type:complete
MSQDRNIKWLNDRRIIYRRNPINDKPTIETDQYMYYENGTYECYTLFNTRAKITTYKSLKWHFLVLYYLNADNATFVANYVFKYIANKENGFVTFFIKQKLLDSMITDVIEQGGEPPVNKIRKVIFKDFSGLNLKEKLTIVGQLIGRSKLDKETIYQCMVDIHDVGKKITIRWMAELLGVSQRTIYRHMCDVLKKEKQILNEEI